MRSLCWFDSNFKRWKSLQTAKLKNSNVRSPLSTTTLCLFRFFLLSLFIGIFNLLCLFHFSVIFLYFDSLHLYFFLSSTERERKNYVLNLSLLNKFLLLNFQRFENLVIYILIWNEYHKYHIQKKKKKKTRDINNKIDDTQSHT